MRAGIRCHGTLWILDRLVERSVVAAERAATALEAMLAAGSRLPEAPTQALLRRWQGGQET